MKDYQEYFVIIDALRNNKYVMPVIEGMGINDLYIFDARFQQRLLEPFYASEEADENNYVLCQKIVGKFMS